MYLTIDAGNTRTKATVFDPAGAIVHSDIFSEDDLAPILSLARDFPDAHFIVSATGHKSWSLTDIPVTGVKLELGPDTALPIRIVYATPETLGRDRIASAVGAWAMLPGKHCLVVDAGTCITMDVVQASGVFLGGNIAPGLQMRLEAMHEKTARLPLVDCAWPALPVGDSTRHALQNGACLGALREIEATWRSARDAFGDVRLVLTGGDAAFLAERIKYEIFAAPALVARGLYQILRFHADAVA